MVGVIALIMFLSTPGMVRWPGERETVVEERHYIADRDEHRRYRT